MANNIKSQWTLDNVTLVNGLPICTEINKVFYVQGLVDESRANNRVSVNIAHPSGGQDKTLLDINERTKLGLPICITKGNPALPSSISGVTPILYMIPIGTDGANTTFWFYRVIANLYVDSNVTAGRCLRTQKSALTASYTAQSSSMIYFYLI